MLAFEIGFSNNNIIGAHSHNDYKNEYDRLLGVMDNVLSEREFLAGEYSIADIATFPWIARHNWHCLLYTSDAADE